MGFRRGFCRRWGCSGCAVAAAQLGAARWLSCSVGYVYNNIRLGFFVPGYVYTIFSKFGGGGFLGFMVVLWMSWVVGAGHHLVLWQEWVAGHARLCMACVQYSYGSVHSTIHAFSSG